MKPNESTRERVMAKSFFVNASLIAIKGVGGLVFSSTALIADAFHSFSDLMSDILVIFGIRQTKKPPDSEHPMGHGKIEYVLSIFLGFGVLFIAYQIGRQAVAVFGDTPTAPSVFALVVVGFVIVSKLLLSRYLLARADVLHSQVLRASGKESFVDVLGSVVVLIGVLFGYIGGRTGITWLVYADSVAALFLVLFIVRVALVILADSVSSIIGKTAPASVIEETKTLIEQVEGVRGVDKLTMLVYGHYYQVMVDIRVDGSQSVAEGHDIAHEVRKRLREEQHIEHVTVHVNPEVES